MLPGEHASLTVNRVTDCPCGAEHELNGGEYLFYLAMKHDVSLNIIAGTGRKAWFVPRVYVGCHGPVIENLPVVAKELGWPRVIPGVLQALTQKGE